LAREQHERHKRDHLSEQIVSNREEPKQKHMRMRLRLRSARACISAGVVTMVCATLSNAYSAEARGTGEHSTSVQRHIPNMRMRTAARHAPCFMPRSMSGDNSALPPATGAAPPASAIPEIVPTTNTEVMSARGSRRRRSHRREAAASSSA
jgi:hypothetical protein